jgi:hypothetical protein
LQNLREFGRVNIEGMTYTARQTISETDDWRVALMNASNVITSCATRQMIGFCMGRGCEFEATRNLDLADLTEQTPVSALTEELRQQPRKIVIQLMEINRSSPILN